MTLAGRFTILFALAMLCCTPGVRGDEPTSMRDRFLNEAPKVWAEAEENNKNIQVEISSLTKNRTEDGKYWTTRQQAVAKACGKSFLIQTTDFPAEGNAPEPRQKGPGMAKYRVDVVNEQRLFYLRRQEEDLPWRIIRYAPADDKRAASFVEGETQTYIKWPWCIADWRLPGMYRNPGFHLEQVEEIHDGNRTLAKVTFTFTPEKDGRRNDIRSGWVLLDPQRRWSILQSEAHLVSPNNDVANWSESIEYRGTEEAIPLRATSKLEHVGKNRGVETTTEFVKYQRGEIPQSEFTLAAFGMETPAESSLDKQGFVIDYFGKEPPPLQISDARGVNKDVKLADFHGKWVLLEFWGPNCAPCLQKSLPALMKFYEEHAADRKRFEVIGVCVITDNDGPKTVEQLDSIMARTVEKAWSGKPLPFPIVIDSEGKTFVTYHVMAVPATILIGPDGHVVRDGDVAMLAEKLKE